MMDAGSDRLDDAARALGESLPAIDASLDERVMARIRARAVSAQPAAAGTRPVAIRGHGKLRWLLEPRAVKVRPVWIPLALAAAALLVWVLSPRTAPLRTTVASVASVHYRDTVYVRFQITAPEAKAVSVAGSFNNWSPASLNLRRDASGSWEATVPLPVGEHRYLFVVDGQRWVPDPTAQAQVDDGFGGTNSVIVVGPKGVVRS
jgi:hypothetical protein